MKIDFGKNFRNLRKNKGVTQEKIAEILGVSCQSVSRWELGTCYPDFELLPIISNYFNVSIDILLSNDSISIEKDKNSLVKKAKEFEYGSDEYISFMRECCLKYPNDDVSAINLVDALSYNISNNPSNREKYLPMLRKGVERLSETVFRDSAIGCMINVCDDEELDYWLERCPVLIHFTKRGCLSSRYLMKNEYDKYYINQGLNMLEVLTVLLNQPFLDKLGPEMKSDYLHSVLKIIKSFGGGETIPDGWKVFFARKQLVLAACLFRLGKNEEAWSNFDSAISAYKYINDLEDEYLDLGGQLFSNLKIRKDLWTVIDKDGNIYDLCDVSHSFCSLEELYDILTDTRWHWFDSVRHEEKYQTAVNWTKSMIQI